MRYRADAKADAEPSPRYSTAADIPSDDVIKRLARETLRRKQYVFRCEQSFYDI